MNQKVDQIKFSGSFCFFFFMERTRGLYDFDETQRPMNLLLKQTQRGKRDITLLARLREPCITLSQSEN